MTTPNESTLELALLDWLRELGWSVIFNLHGNVRLTNILLDKKPTTYLKYHERAA